MKMCKVLFGSALLNGAFAHYVFNRLVINDVPSKEFQYVRDLSSYDGLYNDLWQKAMPLYGPADEWQKCGRGSWPISNTDTIETAVLAAGSKVGFMLSGGYYKGDVQPYIFHGGPGHMFLSKLPSEFKELGEYDGSGDFFKIGYAGPKSATSWSLNGTTVMYSTIPLTTPPGLYLLRIEHIFASTQLGKSQFFVSCAHVEITGEGGGTPGPMARFPNAYKDDDPGLWFHKNGTEQGWPDDFMTYVDLKPEVWSG